MHIVYECGHYVVYGELGNYVSQWETSEDAEAALKVHKAGFFSWLAEAAVKNDASLTPWYGRSNTPIGRALTRHGEERVAEVRAAADLK